jgi:hypothetical protein
VSARTESFIAFAKVSNAKRDLRRAKHKNQQLTGTLRRTQGELIHTKERIRYAMNEGANAILKADLLPELLKDMAEAFAHEYGKVAQTHLDRLRSSDRQIKPITLSANFVETGPRRELRVQGVIPELRYCVVVTP